MCSCVRVDTEAVVGVSWSLVRPRSTYRYSVLVVQFGPNRLNNFSGVSNAVIDPNISTGFLYSDLLYDALDRAKSLHVNHLLPRKDRVTGDLVAEAHDAGMAVMAWTADRLDEFRKLVVWQVDAIATNYPDRLIEFYQR